MLPTPADLCGVSALERLRYPVRLAALGFDPEQIVRFLWENPTLLAAAKRDPTRPITVERVRPTLRVGPDGFVVSEIGATSTQEFRLTAAEARKIGLVTRAPVFVCGGGQLRFDEGGRLSFAAFKLILDADRQKAKLAVQTPVRPADAAVPSAPPVAPPATRAAPLTRRAAAPRITAPAREVSARRRPTFYQES